MLILLGVVAYFGVIAWSLSFVMRRIRRRARTAGVSPVGALVLAYFGYLAGTITSIFAGLGLLWVLFPNSPPDALIVVTLILSSVVGTVVGSGFGYVVLWGRTTHDPDYEELRVPRY